MPLLHDEVRDYAKASPSGNDASAAYTLRVATVIDPADPVSGNPGCVKIVGEGALTVPQALDVMAYCLGANNNTFSVRVTGWTKFGTLWLPQVLCEYDCVAGNIPGAAGTGMIATEFLADTYTLVANMGTDNQGTAKVSPADDSPGHFVVGLKGCQRVEFQFKRGTATSANALYRGF